MTTNHKYSQEFYLTVIFILITGVLSAQENYKIDSNPSNEQIRYSKLDLWYYRTVQESSIVGGETKKLYEVGKPENNSENSSETKDKLSPWATTNIHAKIGVELGNTCVFPEKTEDGFCCRMETKIRAVNIIGLKFKVLVSGALFLGEVIEPVKSIQNPIQKLNHGIPFSGKPKAVNFSYKYSPGQNRIKSVFSSESVQGADKAEFCFILQKRWEDEKGNVYAIRIGGTRNFLNGTNNSWVKDTTVNIYYGDITNEPFYDEKTMGLIPQVNELYVKNSKGKMVPLIETGWDTKNEKPTHLIMYFSSSYEGIQYIGSPESVLWVDNINLNY